MAQQTQQKSYFEILRDTEKILCFIEYYKADFEEYDKKTFEDNPESSFIFMCRTSGTYLVKISNEKLNWTELISNIEMLVKYNKRFYFCHKGMVAEAPLGEVKAILNLMKDKIRRAEINEREFNLEEFLDDYLPIQDQIKNQKQ